MNMPNRVLTDLAGLLVIVILVGYGAAWYFKNPNIPAGVTVEAKPAQEVKHETPIVTIKPPVVKVYQPGVKGKLKLPQVIANDVNQHVIASSQTAADELPHTITTVIDAQTGEAQTFDRTDPLPWVAINTKSEAGIYYGLKHGEQAIRIEGRQELLQVKSIHMGAIASADMMRAGTDGFVGVGLWARW